MLGNSLVKFFVISSPIILPLLFMCWWPVYFGWWDYEILSIDPEPYLKGHWSDICLSFSYRVCIFLYFYYIPELLITLSFSLNYKVVVSVNTDSRTLLTLMWGRTLQSSPFYFLMTWNINPWSISLRISFTEGSLYSFCTEYNLQILDQLILTIVVTSDWRIDF